MPASDSQDDGILTPHEQRAVYKVGFVMAAPLVFMAILGDARTDAVRKVVNVILGASAQRWTERLEDEIFRQTFSTFDAMMFFWQLGARLLKPRRLMADLGHHKLHLCQSGHLVFVQPNWRRGDSLHRI